MLKQPDAHPIELPNRDKNIIYKLIEKNLNKKKSETKQKHSPRTPLRIVSDSQSASLIEIFCRVQDLILRGYGGSVFFFNLFFTKFHDFVKMSTLFYKYRKFTKQI